MEDEKVHSFLNFFENTLVFFVKKLYNTFICA